MVLMSGWHNNHANAAIMPAKTAVELAKAAKTGVNSAKQTVSPVCGAEFTPGVVFKRVFIKRSTLISAQH